MKLSILTAMYAIKKQDIINRCLFLRLNLKNAENANFCRYVEQDVQPLRRPLYEGLIHIPPFGRPTAQQFCLLPFETPLKKILEENPEPNEKYLEIFQFQMCQIGLEANEIEIITDAINYRICFLPK